MASGASLLYIAAKPLVCLYGVVQDICHTSVLWNLPPTGINFLKFFNRPCLEAFSIHDHLIFICSFQVSHANLVIAQQPSIGLQLFVGDDCTPGVVIRCSDNEHECEVALNNGEIKW